MDDVVMETLESTERAIRDALNGWPLGDGTLIHVRVDIEQK